VLTNDGDEVVKGRSVVVGVSTPGPR